MVFAGKYIFLIKGINLNFFTEVLLMYSWPGEDNNKLKFVTEVVLMYSWPGEDNNKLQFRH